MMNLTIHAVTKVEFREAEDRVGYSVARLIVHHEDGDPLEIHLFTRDGVFMGPTSRTLLVRTDDAPDDPKESPHDLPMTAAERQR